MVTIRHLAPGTDGRASELRTDLSESNALTRPIRPLKLHYVSSAVIPYPGCAGWLGTLSPADALTATSSHELREAITDAVSGTGWYDDANGEIGDICACRTKPSESPQEPIVRFWR